MINVNDFKNGMTNVEFEEKYRSEIREFGRKL